MNFNTGDTELDSIVQDVAKTKRERKNYSFELTQRIVGYLDKSRISIVRMSEKTGIPVGTISRWKNHGLAERKKRSPVIVQQYRPIHDMQPKQKKSVKIKKGGFEIEVELDDLKDVMRALE